MEENINSLLMAGYGIEICDIFGCFIEWRKLYSFAKSKVFSRLINEM